MVGIRRWKSFFAFGFNIFSPPYTRPWVARVEGMVYIAGFISMGRCWGCVVLLISKGFGYGLYCVVVLQSFNRQLKLIVIFFHLSFWTVDESMSGNKKITSATRRTFFHSIAFDCFEFFWVLSKVRSRIWFCSFVSCILIWFFFSSVLQVLQTSSNKFKASSIAPFLRFFLRVEGERIAWGSNNIIFFQTIILFDVGSRDLICLFSWLFFSV